MGALWILAVGYFGLDHVQRAADVVRAQSTGNLAAQYSATLGIMKDLVIGSLAIALILIVMSMRVLVLSREPKNIAEPGQAC